MGGWEGEGEEGDWGLLGSLFATQSPLSACSVGVSCLGSEVVPQPRDWILFPVLEVAGF